MVSFQCAWLKAHFPAYFMARVIAHEGGFYHHAAYFEEARRHGITPLAPCILRSEWLTKAESPTTIRCGFHHLPALAGKRAASDQRAPAPALHLAERFTPAGASFGRGRYDGPRWGAGCAVSPGTPWTEILWLARQVGLQPLPKPATIINSIYYRRPNIMTQRFPIYHGQISAAVPRPIKGAGILPAVSPLSLMRSTVHGTALRADTAHAAWAQSQRLRAGHHAQASPGQNQGRVAANVLCHRRGQPAAF